MSEIIKFATDAEIIESVATFPVYGLNSAADSFELACEIGVGSVHAWTPDDVRANDNGKRTLVLGTIIADELTAAGYAFAGPVVLVAANDDTAVWRLADAVKPAAVVTIADLSFAPGLARYVRPFLGD